MTIFQFLIKPLLFTWELPQNLLGMLVFSIMRIRNQFVSMDKQGHHFYIETANTGVSLGWFIFWTPAGNRFSHFENDCRMHEFGHSRQSVFLGPLYLIVIGIPSLSRVFYSRWYRRKYGCNWKNYFNGFPENWADKLGGVNQPKK